MAHSHQTKNLAVDNRSRQWPPPPPSPSSFYIRPPTRLNYYAPLPPLSEHPLLELRRPTYKDACFTVSALSPLVPNRYASDHDSVGTCLLDRFLYQQAYSPITSDFGHTYDHTIARTPIDPNIAKTPTTPSSRAPNLWAYTETPLTPRNPRNVWAFMAQDQWPAPSGRRRHSRVKSIEEKSESKYSSIQKPDTTSTNASNFRQPPKGQPPRPLKDRTIIPQGTNPIIEISASTPESSPVSPIKLPQQSKRQPPPSPIDVQLARDKAVKQLNGMLTTPPPSGSTGGTITPRGKAISPGRGVLLSPLNTQVNGNTDAKGVRIQVVISPIFSPTFSDPLSPISMGRPSQSSTPPIWSPQTPIAMAFEFDILVEPNTPPLPSLESLAWRDDISVIDESPQEEEPLELAPPRGRLFAESLSPKRNHNKSSSPYGYHDSVSFFSPYDTPTSAKPKILSRSNTRARSLSPLRSTHPTTSTFYVDPTNIYNKFATDENFDLKSPLVAPKQMVMVESPKRYMPKSYKHTNPRDAILGTYFKRGVTM